MPTQKPTWEERFDEKFEGELWLGKTGEIQDDDGEPDTPDRRELKDFIRQLLQQERGRIIEKLLAYKKAVDLIEIINVDKTWTTTKRTQEWQKLLESLEEQ